MAGQTSKPGPSEEGGRILLTPVENARERLSEQFVVGAVFVSALFMSILDTTVVNVAVPTIGRQFHAGNSQVQWIATGYLLSLAVWMPASGWIADRFGTKRVLLTAIALFTAGSVLCAAAGSLGELVAARLIQGVGGGMLQPVGMEGCRSCSTPSARAHRRAGGRAPSWGQLWRGWRS
jgi:MFS family permease